MIELAINSKSREELIDITSEVEDIVVKKGWNNGILHIYTPHTTAAITINENADYTVKEDIIKFLSKLVPSNFPFMHLEGNSDAHLKSSIIGCSENIIVEEGRLVLGTWQGVFFCEFDGPRRRKVYLKFISG
ncbi:secondary thiamine-phosphate synthase enzyme YjbQ [Deferribacter abyssi]|uniref:secondary thiamine-phosphate synthase enzyme YjbQ n=1 Tax=Deferribacter abyssi TaxID=213806 RepID=UPI003C261EC5